MDADNATTRSSARVLNFNQYLLQGVWQEDVNFFTKFFPVDDNIRGVFQRSKRGMYWGTRWSRMPPNPTAASQLYTPLNNLINNILKAFNLMYDDEGNRRLSLNTSKTHVDPEADYPIWPPLLLAGSGNYFLSFTESASFNHYALGISPLEVRLEDQDPTLARDRLATNMQQLMSYQHNRRYAFGLVVSHQTLTAYMFDRSGILSSPSLDYHANPEQFCAIIAGLASYEAERLGIDTSMFRDNGGTVMTKEVMGKNRSKVVKYSLLAILYYASNLVGRGTICFAAFETSAPKNRYVIKDSWVASEELEGKESEASLIAHARSLGISKGIPQVRHTEDVRIKGHAGRMRLDTVLNNRQTDSYNDATVDRVHTRLIMSPYGKPLHRFSTRNEFLIAYRDALQAHRNLYEVAGILHRDVKPENILINPHGAQGDRGVLIDFDHAIRVVDSSPYSTKRNIGTYLFMSRGALDGKPQAYMDDLESFYYVMVYITQKFTAPGCLTERQPDILREWDTQVASSSKNGFFATPSSLIVETWWGPSFQILLERLHAIFNHLVMARFVAEFDKQPPPVVDEAQVYSSFLTHVNEAIHNLSLEQSIGESVGDTLPTAQGAFNDVGNTDRDFIGKQPSGVFSWMEVISKRRTGIAIVAAANRPRRKGVNYNLTKLPAQVKRRTANLSNIKKTNTS